MKKITICLTAVTFAAAAALSGCSNNIMTLPAEDYYEVKVEGLDGNADVSFRVNELELNSTILEAFGNINPANAEQYAKYTEVSRKLDDLEDTMTYVITSDKKEDFSNGDVIEVTLSYDKELASEINVSFSDVTFSYTVKGLTEGTSVDPFDGLKVEYSGIAPNASVSFDTTECDDYVRNNVKFYVDGSSSGLSNGEVIDVVASYDETKAESNAIIVTQTSKQYTVEGVLEYPATLDGADLTDIEAQFSDMLEGNALSKYYTGAKVPANGSWSSNFEITKVEAAPILRAYMVAKDFSSYNSYNNQYDYIWDIKITGKFTSNSGDYKSGDTATLSAYYVAYIQNIPVDTDGNIPTEYLTNYKGELYGPGEKTYNEVYNNWITAHKADYNITEMTVE